MEWTGGIDASDDGTVDVTGKGNILLFWNDRMAVGGLNFEVDDLQMLKGETYTVDFKAKELNQLFEYQFSLVFYENAVEFNDLSVGVLENLTEDNPV